jgi:dTDP-4-amino-4,6-dideoxy-D-galactose acyltransferase
MIEKLQWDSEKFQLEVGKFNAQTPEDLQQFTAAEKSAFDLIYIFCPPTLSKSESNWFSGQKLSLLDRRQNFTRKVSADEFIETDPHIQPVSELSDKLLDLTFQSGSHSRFKTDNRLDPGIFEMLYRTWITRSVNKEIAKEVFGYFEGDTLLGLITYGVKNNSGDIGLIAVDGSQRGKGLGKKLIHQVIARTQKDGFDSLTVATQGLNTGAIHFYQSCGFRVTDEMDVYHFWTS